MYCLKQVDNWNKSNRNGISGLIGFCDFILIRDINDNVWHTIDFEGNIISPVVYNKSGP